MGAGVVSRYKSSPEDGYDPNTWRKPKERSRWSRSRTPKASGGGSSAKTYGSSSPGAVGAGGAMSSKAPVVAYVEVDHSSLRPPKHGQVAAATPGPALGLGARDVASHSVGLSGLSSPPPGMSATTTTTAGSRASTANSAWTEGKSAANWPKATTERFLPSGGALLALGGPGVVEDDEDFGGFSNLADAATKVWEELMNNREAVGSKDVSALFNLGDMKDCVERAVRRVEALRREVTIATARAEEKRQALESLCTSLEERAIPGAGASTRWKLGDIAVRRGKGLCELSMVHHEADPPYFEVRMLVSGSVVGTEAGNLIPLAPPQQSLARAALRDLEQARNAHHSTEEALVQAQEDLKQQHAHLTDQVERKLQEITNVNSPGSGGPMQMAAFQGPGAAGYRAAPPGLPDLDLVRKWTTPPPPTAGSEAAPLVAYPDMKGVKEDMRGSSGGNLPGAVASPQRQREQAAQYAQPAQPAQPWATVTPSAPMGFPSLDELGRLEQQAQERERLAAAAAARIYPEAHRGASREFLRHSDPAVGVPAGASALGEAGMPSAPSSLRQRAQAGSRTMPGSSSKENVAMPAGFPKLDPNLPAASSPQVQQHHAHQQQQQAHQEAQQQHAYAHQQQQQAHQQAAQRQEAYQQQQQQQQVPHQWPATDWVLYRTAEGQPYFHNERTNETAWNLPPGVHYREPGAQGAPDDPRWQQQQAAEQPAPAAAADDPFAELRQREEEMRQQREHWAAWYAQYSQWYQQQAGAAAQQHPGVPNGAPPNFTGQRSHTQQVPHFGTSAADPSSQGATPGAGAVPPRPGTGSGLPPPKGPKPPVLSAGFEDHAVFALKVSVLKEMEAMVEQEAPVQQRKKALRCLQMRWHPDKNPERLEVAKSVFQFIEETKEWFLHDPNAEAPPAS